MNSLITLLLIFFFLGLLTQYLIWQFCSRRLWTYFVNNWKISIIEWITYDSKWKTLWQKEKLLVLSNLFFCHYVFKKPSAAEASESVYVRERVKILVTLFLWQFVVTSLLGEEPFPLTNACWCNSFCSRPLLKTFYQKEKLLTILWTLFNN